MQRGYVGGNKVVIIGIIVRDMDHASLQPVILVIGSTDTRRVVQQETYLTVDAAMVDLTEQEHEPQGPTSPERRKRLQARNYDSRIRSRRKGLLLDRKTPGLELQARLQVE